MQENIEIKKLCKGLEEDPTSMKTLRSVMSLITSTCLLEFKRGDLENLFRRVQREFARFFGLDETKVKVSAFGLSGAGIYFNNSTIKTLLRIADGSRYLEKLTH